VKAYHFVSDNLASAAWDAAWIAAWDEQDAAWDAQRERFRKMVEAKFAEVES